MSLAPPANPVRPGFRLDRYELLWQIAEGGMASVWLARQSGKHGFEKLVAVKTILPKFAQDERFQRMFLDEARIASGIDHTNVARILDLGEEHGVLYIAMEWVDGDSLSKVQRLLAKKGIALPHGVVLRLLADACAGLHAAHELRDRTGTPLGVVHRDVSPQNILISADGVAKLIDFGIAKARDRASGETETGTLKGKIEYMAPEQALGRPLDRRADVWAVGAVLYNFFVGRPPYDAPSQVTSLQMLSSGQPPPPLPPKIAPMVAHVITGALQWHPESRWGNVDDMRRTLERAMLEMGCPTTAADVASFVATYLPERAALRKQTVERALAAAQERVPLPQEPPSIQSKSGLADVKARTPASLVTTNPPDAPTASRRNGTAEAATLGSTALDAPPIARHGIGVALGAIAATGTLAAGVAALLYVLRMGGGGPKVDPPPAAPPTADPAASSLDLPPIPPATGTAVDAEGSASPGSTASAGTPQAQARGPSRTPLRPPPRAASDGGKAPKVIDDGF